MTATWRVGHGGAAGAQAMGEYLTTETLTPEPGTAAAYYLGDVPARRWGFIDHLGQQIAAGEISHAEALDAIVLAEVRANEPQGVVDFERRIADELSRAALRAETEAVTGKPADRVGAIARVREDLSPHVANRLGIGHEPLSQEALTRLLSGRRTDGGEIEGKMKRSPGRSVAEVFGLPTKGTGCTPPDETAIRNILAGKRADGADPRMKGEELPKEVVAGALKRFLAIYDAPRNRPLTDVEIGNMAEGRMARGTVAVTDHYWQTRVNAKQERVTFLDLTLSADKSVSIAWALAPTEAERAIVQTAHRDAVAKTMAYLESQIAQARRGDSGNGGIEQGKVAWFSFDHYTSRPTVDFERIDKEGQAYTDFATVPHIHPDMQLHTHTIVPNTVLTDTGHVGSMDLDRLNGITKTVGAIYQAHLAHNLRKHGVDVVRDQRTGAARIAAVPERVARNFSKRSQEAEVAAKRYAEVQGLNWDELSGERKSALMKAGAEALRQRKDRDHDAPSDFSRWKDEAAMIGYQHRSVLRTDETQPELSPERRIDLAYRVTARDLAEAFHTKAVIGLDEAKEIAAHSLIVAGIGDAAKDIAAVMQTVKRRGIEIAGEQTPIVFAINTAVRGKISWSLTTGLAERQEQEVTARTREIAKDRTVDLTPQVIERASERFLAGRPDIDRDAAQWQAQRRMMDGLAMNGRLSLGIGAAGAGKTTVLTPLVDAWKEDGRTVYGAALAWRQTEGLRDSGIVQLRKAGIEATAALDPFISRVERGKITLDHRSVVVIDEVALLGTRQLHKLTTLQQRHGFQLVMLGDPAQCAAVEAGPVIRLMQAGLGKDAVPEIVTNIRQKAARELETTTLWREGRAAEALDRKQRDGDLKIVSGPRSAVIKVAADHWQERRAAMSPGKTLLVIAPSNDDAHEIGMAIRERKRDAGELGPDLAAVRTRDPNARTDREITLAVGDHVRLFNRVQDGRTVLGNNGDAVEVLHADMAGMRARNIATGIEASATWRQLTPLTSDRPALAYGYATTIYTSQSQTVSEAMFVLPGGSRQVDRGRAYTALSRHQHRVSLIVSEGAERRDISRHWAPGSFRKIEPAEIRAHIADNLARKTEKASADELLRNAAIVRRGHVQAIARTMEPIERLRKTGQIIVREFDRVRLEGVPELRQVREVMQRAMAPGNERERGPGLER
jgi:hypothetical protein